MCAATQMTEWQLSTDMRKTSDVTKKCICGLVFSHAPLLRTHTHFFHSGTNRQKTLWVSYLQSQNIKTTLCTKTDPCSLCGNKVVLRSDTLATRENLQQFVTAGHWLLLGNSCFFLPHCGKLCSCLNYCNRRFDHDLGYTCFATRITLALKPSFFYMF